MRPRAHLFSLATALPPHLLWQREVALAARAVFGEQFERLSGVFENVGIVKRHGVRPLEWYLEPRGWPERTEAYLDGAAMLFVQAAETALAQAGLRGADIDAVVTLSSTGIATPSLDALVFAHGVSRGHPARSNLRPGLRRRRMRSNHCGEARRGAARNECP